MRISYFMQPFLSDLYTRKAEFGRQCLVAEHFQAPMWVLSSDYRWAIALASFDFAHFCHIL
jgi:hypothetical protein